MPDPVIVDDGGSTRIKQLNRELNGLPNQNQPESKDYALGPFTRISMVYISKTGVPTVPAPDNPPAAPLQIQLLVGDGFELFSENDQRIQGTIVDRTVQLTGGMPGTAADLEIKIKSIGGNKPYVVHKSVGGQHTYHVENAGAIQQLIVNIRRPHFTDPIFTVPPDAVFTLVALF